MGSSQSVGNICLAQPNLSGKILDNHELKIIVLLTNPDITRKKETNDSDTM